MSGQPVLSFALVGPFGLDAGVVEIRCSIDASKPPSFHVEGAAIQQAKEIGVRVRSAIMQADLCAWPAGRVTIALDAGGAKIQAPALDLPIALAIAGVGVDRLLVAGELGLDGSVRPVRGALQAARLAEARGLRGVLLPAKNVREALEGSDSQIVVHAINGLSEVSQALSEVATCAPLAAPYRSAIDFSEVRGQAPAIEAVSRSVMTRAGLLLSGPPGAGKTMIARRIPSVLPPMTRDQRIEVTRAYSAIGLADGLLAQRPFRAPHHTISAAALVGGGTSRRPGEAQLAMYGVLLLDELAEFGRSSIEALAQALDQMPAAARPLVVASANPCPCGWHGSEVRACSCTADAVKRYAARIEWAAGKLGLTITAQVRSMPLDAMRGPAGESSAVIAGRIAAAVGA